MKTQDSPEKWRESGSQVTGSGHKSTHASEDHWDRSSDRAWHRRQSWPALVAGKVKAAGYVHPDSEHLRGLVPGRARAHQQVRRQTASQAHRVLFATPEPELKPHRPLQAVALSARRSCARPDEANRVFLTMPSPSATNRDSVGNRSEFVNPFNAPQAADGQRKRLKYMANLTTSLSAISIFINICSGRCRTADHIDRTAAEAGGS